MEHNYKRAIRVLFTHVILLILFFMFIGFSRSLAWMENIKIYKLENGLEIITIEDHTVPIVSYFTFFKTGSRNENLFNTGISHLFEHLMFKGTKQYPAGEFDNVIESNGGYSNAYTTEDYTAYYENFPVKLLPKIIEMEATRMEELLLDKDNLDSERQVVLEERLLTVENIPVGKMYEELQSLAFMAHPYQLPVIGWKSSVSHFTLDDINSYYKKHYAPNNSFIVVAGDFQTKNLINEIKKYYNPIIARNVFPPRYPTEPAQTGTRRADIKMNAQLPAILMGFHVPGINNNDIWALDLLQVIISWGESSRLYKLLIHDENLVNNLYSEFSWHLDPFLFYIYTQLKPGVDHRKVENLIFQELSKIKNQGISDRELQKGKNILKVNTLQQLKTLEGKAEMVGITYLLFGDQSYLPTILEKYHDLKSIDISNAVAKYFNRDNASIVYLHPVSEGGSLE